MLFASDWLSFQWARYWAYVYRHRDDCSSVLLRALMVVFKSFFIWFAVLVCTILWVPLVGCVGVFDRTRARFRTGRCFRRLGVAVTKLNPFWRLRVEGVSQRRLGTPYVVVSNHQSLVDIPLISHLPWEMKWVAKRSLFRVPLIGWMLRMAGDIPLDRGDSRSGARSLLRAAYYLRQGCPVMFFPEGTRSADGRVGRFHDGAFRLALRERVDVLPIVVDGSRACLPKHSWRFGTAKDIRVRVLSPIKVAQFRSDQTAALREEARQAIIRQLAQWRGTSEAAVDSLVGSTEGSRGGTGKVAKAIANLSTTAAASH